MALMKFREQNHVLWRGVRPGHDGTQVYGGAYQGGAGNSILYTVGAGKTLFITYAGLSTRDSAGAGGEGKLDIYTAVPGFWRYIFHHLMDITGQLTNSETFPFPLEVPATYTVRVESTAAGIDVYGMIWGWEE